MAEVCVATGFERPAENGLHLTVDVCVAVACLGLHSPGIGDESGDPGTVFAGGDASHVGLPYDGSEGLVDPSVSFSY